ncbi:MULTISPECIES: serine aminopeptidase domain-containing protein [unclassified Geodermatophilus]|uniref:serine aminopeptidase domain-containing protein n=1 Tax=unclassified Geodermatophilus TaxID=2637632 RepID=UPI003EEEA2A7
MPGQLFPVGMGDRPSRGARRRVAALATTALLAGCGGGAAESPEVPEVEPEVTELTVDAQDAVAIAPGEGDPRGLVVFLHGLDDDAGALSEEQKRIDMVDRLVAAGYVVAGSDGHLNAFGNEASQAGYVALAAELAERYGTTDTYLIAESMGAVAGLQLLADERIPDVRGMALISPLVDLDVVLGTQQEPQVLQAYDGTFPTGEQNPAARPAEDWAGTSMRFYLATEDEVVINADNAEPFVARVEDAADISVVECEGEHVAPSCFQGEDLAEWFADLP